MLHALREGVDTASPTGRRVAAIMATLAELELELGRERRAVSRESRRTGDYRLRSFQSSVLNDKSSSAALLRQANPCASCPRRSVLGEQPRTTTFHRFGSRRTDGNIRAVQRLGHRINERRHPLVLALAHKIGRLTVLQQMIWREHLHISRDRRGRTSASASATWASSSSRCLSALWLMKRSSIGSALAGLAPPGFDALPDRDGSNTEADHWVEPPAAGPGGGDRQRDQHRGGLGRA